MSHMESAPVDPNPTRGTLLARLKDWRDDESWKEFFNLYWRLIYSAALRAGLNENEAEEVVQETVLSVAKTMPRFEYDRENCSFKSWLMHLTRKRIADQYRKKPPSAVFLRAEPREGTATAERIGDPSQLPLEDVWEAEWQKNLAEVALDQVRTQVSARQYQIFDLYAHKGWKAGEIARTLQISVGQVYLARHRVLKLAKKNVAALRRKMA
jgi:RNA polymerase sigma factor (sigma-70 family)